MYEDPCKDCNKTYIGERKGTLKVKFREHKQAVKRGDPKNGIAVTFSSPTNRLGWCHGQEKCNRHHPHQNEQRQ